MLCQESLDDIRIHVVGVRKLIGVNRSLLTNSHVLNTHRYQLKIASYIAVQPLSAILFRDSYALASSTGRVEAGGSHSLIPEMRSIGREGIRSTRAWVSRR
jgi:hypothetical protein